MTSGCQISVASDVYFDTGLSQYVAATALNTLHPAFIVIDCWLLRVIAGCSIGNGVGLAIRDKLLRLAIHVIIRRSVY